jgi:hypothetical protein
VGGHFGITWVQRRDESVNNFSIPDDMSASVSLTSLKALVSNIFKSHAGGVVACSLLGISDPEFNVIE